MKICSLVGAANIGFIFLLVAGNAAESAELKVLSAIGMQSVLEDLGPKFERATGHKVSFSFATGGAAVKRAQGGEAADVVIVTRQGIDGLVKNGKAAADNVTALASAGIRHQRGHAKGRTQARYLVAGRLETHAARREVDLLCRSSERWREWYPFRQGARSLGDRQRDEIEDGLPQPQNPRRGWSLGCKR